MEVLDRNESRSKLVPVAVANEDVENAKEVELSGNNEKRHDRTTS